MGMANETLLVNSIKNKYSGVGISDNPDAFTNFHVILDLIIILFFIFVLLFPAKNIAQTVKNINKFEVIKNNLFTGKDLEAKFKILYTDPVSQRKRFFEVIKTNVPLNNFFLADYLLVEKVNKKTEYFPLGWQGEKIYEKDILVNCHSIVKGEVSPVTPE